MNLVIEFHGRVRSGYDAQVRAIAQQLCRDAFSLEATAQAIRNDIAKIRRRNTAIAANSYTVKAYEEDPRIEIHNDWDHTKTPRRILTMREDKTHKPEPA